MSGRDAPNGAASSATRPGARGGRDRVTGRLAYVADIPVEDALHVKLVTVDAARARIGRIDATRALAVPGVRLVMTRRRPPVADAALRAAAPRPAGAGRRDDRLPRRAGRGGRRRDPRRRRGGRRAGRRGVRAAAGRDDDRRRARPRVAARPGSVAPARRPARRDERRCASTLRLGRPRRPPSARPRSSSRAPRTFPMVTQFAIEPHAFIAAPDGDGIAVWSSIQHPYWLQRVIATLLDLPLSKVRVFAPDPGGGFGGKQHAKYEPLLAFMALRAGRPVRLVLTLEETFQAVRRAASEVRVRSGFRRDGTLAFRDIEANYLVGAYADIADRVVAKGSYTSNGPYRTPGRPDPSRGACSRTPSRRRPSAASATRSRSGRSSRTWTRRRVRLGIDPLELRLRNLAHRGRPVHPRRHCRPTASGPRRSRRAADRIGWGIAGAAGSRPRHRGRAQGGPDDRALLLDRPAAGRRQRRRLRGDVGHGPGGADDLRPDRGPGAGGAGRLGHGRHGRHRDRAVRPADVGEPVVGADGERRPPRLPRRPGEAADDGRAARGRRRGRDRPSTAGEVPDRRPACCRSATC